MVILGIETSCDDTSASVICGRQVLSNVVSSQDPLHADYGGVVPELAARRHLETIDEVVSAAVERAGLVHDDIRTVAVTRGPGLVGSLLVGIAAARGLGLRIGAPVYGVNHLEGHVLSPLIAAAVEFPFLALLVSGGHTALYLVRAVGNYVELGSTRDDSAGEAFDKAAKMLGLGYPGGRRIDELSQHGDPAGYRFPRAHVRDDPAAFSFSGLKTSLWEFLHGSSARRFRMEDVCASFQEAIVDALLDRVAMAVAQLGMMRLVIAGGVSANRRLRARAAEMARRLGVSLTLAPPVYCTDNAAMIAFAAGERIGRGLLGEPLEATSRLRLGQRLRLS